MLHTHDVERPEPRWPAVLAVVAAAGMYFTLPEALRVDPPEAFTASVLALVAISYLARWRGARLVNEIAGYCTLVVLTGGLVYGLGQLLRALLGHSLHAPELLRAAAVLWATNCLVFAAWYWRLDAGGPNERERRNAHLSGAFLFPQMTALAPGGTGRTIAEVERWRPGFVDYLFVAFTASTAFSPTDVPVLSRWAKGAMMTQAVIAFGTVVLLIGRGVNIL